MPKGGSLAISPVVDVEGKRLSLSNLDKVLYPASGFTKGQVIDYYARIAPALLPHLRGRPVTMKRYPDGVDSEFFYEKNAPKHRPDWVKTAPIWSRHNRRHINYLLVDDLPTLTWLANLASLEIHPSLALGKDINCPTMMVFDLDPGPPANIVQCCQVGLWLREIFEHWGLECFPKTSGSKGLQLYVPLNTPTTYDVTKPFANALARLLEHDHPEMVVSEMKKEVRTGKVFVDWSQNDEHKTTVSVYSLRAREHPTVSTPVTWEEVERALKKKDASLLVFEAPAVVERFEKMGDLHAAGAGTEAEAARPAGSAAAAAPQPATVDLAAQAEEEPRRVRTECAEEIQFEKDGWLDAQGGIQEDIGREACDQETPGGIIRPSVADAHSGQAQKSMAQLFAGTSGWAYPSWKPDFYPQKLAQAKFLSHYATQLNAVEVNFTFRQLVKETTLAKWMADSPEGFRFTIKAHQVITHIKRLKGTEDFVSRFLATIEPLASAGKLGPVLFQLPPNLKVDVEVLKSFLATLPRRFSRLSSSGMLRGFTTRCTRP